MSEALISVGPNFAEADLAELEAARIEQSRESQEFWRNHDARVLTQREAARTAVISASETPSTEAAE